MTSTDAIVRPTGFSHVRLTVTDIRRSKAFYQTLLGPELAFDFSDKIDEPGILEDQSQLFGGCGFTIGSQLLGLRPVSNIGDTFSPTRVGLDHVSLNLGSVEELKAAEKRLTEAGIEHGEFTELGETGMSIVSVQDPDGINLELCVSSG